MTTLLLKPLFLFIQGKKYIIAIATIPLFSLCITITSCKKDETKNCDRDCFVGAWYAKDVRLGFSASYNVNIFASNSDPKGIEIQNFGGSGGTLKATVEDGTFTMPHQDVTQFVSYEGSGILDKDGDTLNVTYKIQNVNTWTGTWSKK